ncbi:MAG: diacylglycerol kinase family lipid kinase, partial [Nitratireductor sp.]
STIEAELVMGETVVRARTPGIGISNNLFGDGPLPIADKPDGGVLGIYIFRTARRLEIAVLFLAMMLGRWKEIETVDIHQSKEVLLRIRSRRRNQVCVIDGELVPLGNETVLRIHPKALRVVVPAEKSR